MRALPLALILLLAPTMALAHPGFHPHPHGIELGWLAVAVLGAAVAGAAVLVWLRRRP
jgi:hypothetical protein